LRAEIEQFFSIYKDLERGKQVAIEGWRARRDALAEIAAARERHLSGGGSG
jgi:inorganic pyrophosphatase